MHGWRGRIGLIVPGNNTVIEPDFYQNLPSGVAVHAAQMDIEGGDEEGFEEQEAEIERCSKALAEGDMDVIVYGVTVGSLIQGVGYENEIEKLIEDIVDVPAVATAASVKRAFDSLGLESLSISTPYIESLNEKEAQFLKDSGYKIVQIKGLGLDSVTEIGNQSTERVYREAKKVDDPDADGIFISCTNYDALDIITELENDVDKPVVTSNQATLWDALKTLGIEHTVDMGQIFSHD